MRRALASAPSPYPGIRSCSTASPLQIRGVNRYDEIAPYGPTVPAELVRRDLEQIKAAGFNLVRVHHPQETALLDLLDEIGLLLIEEVFLNWWGADFFPNRLPTQENAGAVSRAAEAQLEAMIARDYNHPCIILWSMGNECDSASPLGIAVFKRLIARAHHLDPTRLVTYAANGDIAANAAFDAADVVGVNSYPGVFDADPVHHIAELEGRVALPLAQELRAICQRFAGKPVIMTEYGTHGVPGVFGDARLTRTCRPRISAPPGAPSARSRASRAASCGAGPTTTTAAILSAPAACCATPSAPLAWSLWTGRRSGRSRRCGRCLGGKDWAVGLF